MQGRRHMYSGRGGDAPPPRWIIICYKSPPPRMARGRFCPPPGPEEYTSICYFTIKYSHLSSFAPKYAPPASKMCLLLEKIISTSLAIYILFSWHRKINNLWISLGWTHTLLFYCKRFQKILELLKYMVPNTHVVYNERIKHWPLNWQ